MIFNTFWSRLVLSTFLLLVTPIISQSQIKVDSVIDKGIYKSYFSFSLKNPLYVTYYLSKGGGPCKREEKHFSFVADGCKRCAKTSDYTNSHYEKGHLANAEDFAFSCPKEELTFRYYNCVPQTFELNHGAWLQWEASIRELSQSKRLFIIAGSIFGTKSIGHSKVRVPTFCYKIVIDPKTRKTLKCLLFPNNTSGSVREIPLNELRKKLGYPLLPQSAL